MFKKEIQISFFDKNETKKIVSEGIAEEKEELDSYEAESVKKLLRNNDLSGKQVVVDSCTTKEGVYIDHRTIQFFINKNNRIGNFIV